MKADKDFRRGVIVLLIIAILVLVRGYYRTKLDWLQLPEGTISGNKDNGERYELASLCCGESGPL